jgi:hypothetical protein
MQSYGPQSCGSPSFVNFGSPKTKCHLGAGPVSGDKVYCKREGGGFSQV